MAERVVHRDCKEVTGDPILQQARVCSSSPL